MKDIRKQCSGVSKGSHGHLQADDLRGRSVAIEMESLLLSFMAFHLL